MQKKHSDLESGRPSRHGGYATAATFLASDPDSETFVFRKFDTLSAMNLLYMQSEILELEKRFQDLHQTTLEGSMDHIEAASRWETLLQQQQCGEPRANQRMGLILDLRKKIKEYHEALLLQRDIASLKQPEDRVTEAVKHYFEVPHPVLGGKAKNLFNPQYNNDFKDLVGLRAGNETDLLSSFLRHHWRGKDEMAGDGVSRFKRFEEASIARTVNFVTIVLAAIFLIGTIVGFYFVERPAVKLGMIAAFTTAFAGCLGLITNARRVEMFAATAAYAAVLVVFVSNSELSAASSAGRE